MGAKCDICPLKGRSPVFGDGPNNATIGVVLDQPSKEEAMLSIPFVSRGAEYIEALLNRAGHSRNAVLLDYAVACFPPDGDLKTFLTLRRRAAKESLKAEGRKGAPQKEPHPVDCCRPRLMKSLGVPQCKKCGKWRLMPEHPEKCSCERPSWVLVKDRREVTAVLAAGNLALESLTGHPGVQTKQMYVFGSER